MPGIGEGRKSSSFDPAGKRFSKAARGSAAWPPGGVCPGSAVAARAQNPAVQAARVKAARILNILGAPAELDSSTLRESGGSRDSSRTAQIPRPWAFVWLAARVVLGMQFFQALAGDVGVDLRRRQIAGPQKHLHDAEI